MGRLETPRLSGCTLVAADACDAVLVSSRDRDLAAWWESLRKEVGQAVDEVDPEGLLAMGAPDGEYSNEADRLTSLVVRDDLNENSVLAVWEAAFGKESKPSRRTALLAVITKRLREVQGSHPRP